MVRYFIAAAAICSAASLIARTVDGAEPRNTNNLRALYATSVVSVQESAPTYYPSYSPTLAPTSEVVPAAKMVTIKDDSWKCAAQTVKVRSWGAPATISTIDEVWYGSAGYATEAISTSGGKSGKLGVSSSSTSSSKVSKVGVNGGGKSGKNGVVGSTTIVESLDTLDSEPGWSTGDGWHSAAGGRRLSSSWGAPPVAVQESPEIVWVGSAQSVPRAQVASTTKAEKVEPIINNAGGWGSSVSSVTTTKVQSSATKAEKVEPTIEAVGGWGSSVSTVKAAKPTSTIKTVTWGSSVSVTSTNAPTICQTIVEASPTQYPTEAPTSCSSRFAIWYYNTESGKCVNDDTNTEFLVGEYESMDKCCEAQFTDEAEYEYCKLYLYEDKCCFMENHLWFYDSLLEVCTNDMTLVVDNENTEFYNEDLDCCKGEFINQSICPTRDVCIPEPPEVIVTVEPTKEPTPAPSAAPTTCVDMYSVWYYDVNSGVCVTGTIDSVVVGYGSVDECCGAQFSDASEYEYCKEYLHVDTCCLIENHVWHFDGEVCTNAGVEGSNDGEGYDEDFECCIAQFGKFPCPVQNICIPEPPPETATPTAQPTAPELVTSVPTVPEVITMEPTTSAPITPSPTEMEVVTIVPTTSMPVTPVPSITEILTVAPTFGSTPTVSKETTGPPTQLRDESGSSGSSFTEDVNTDCVEHNDKVWSTESNSMVDVCVYICTVTTTIYDGDEVYDTNVHKTNSECP